SPVTEPASGSTSVLGGHDSSTRSPSGESRRATFVRVAFSSPVLSTLTRGAPRRPIRLGLTSGLLRAPTLSNTNHTTLGVTCHRVEMFLVLPAALDDAAPRAAQTQCCGAAEAMRVLFANRWVLMLRDQVVLGETRYSGRTTWALIRHRRR